MASSTASPMTAGRPWATAWTARSPRDAAPVASRIRRSPSRPVSRKLGRPSRRAARARRPSGRQVGRLGEQLDHAAAAEAHAPQLVALRGVVDRDHAGRIDLDRLAGQARRLLLEASAADEADRRPVARDEQAGAGAAVRRAAHRDDRGERERRAAARRAAAASSRSSISLTRAMLAARRSVEVLPQDPVESVRMLEVDHVGRLELLEPRTGHRDAS